jgi:coenzyme F420-reducing hydrogenase beta subunit
MSDVLLIEVAVSPVDVQALRIKEKIIVKMKNFFMDIRYRLGLNFVNTACYQFEFCFKKIL